MAAYTTELRTILESLAGRKTHAGYDEMDDVIDAARPLVFDFSYPIFDEAYRPILEKKILENFYMREICCETYGLWKFYLRRHLRNAMPYFNKLYESDLLKFNPLYEVDTTTTHKGSDMTADSGENETQSAVQNRAENENSNAATSGSHSNGDSTDTIANSDTPQNELSGVFENNYLTTAQHNTRHGENDATGQTASTASGSSNDQSIGSTSGNDNRQSMSISQYEDRVLGTHGGMTMAKKLMEFRESFLNIDELVLQSCNTLFFMIY